MRDLEKMVHKRLCSEKERKDNKWMTHLRQSYNITVAGHRTVMFAMLTRHLKCVFKSDIHLLCIILMFEQVCFIHPSIASLGKYLLYTLFQNTHPSLPTSIHPK